MEILVDKYGRNIETREKTILRKGLEHAATRLCVPEFNSALLDTTTNQELTDYIAENGKSEVKLKQEDLFSGNTCKLQNKKKEPAPAPLTGNLPLLNTEPEDRLSEDRNMSNNERREFYLYLNKNWEYLTREQQDNLIRDIGFPEKINNKLQASKMMKEVKQLVAMKKKLSTDKRKKCA